VTSAHPRLTSNSSPRSAFITAPTGVRHCLAGRGNALAAPPLPLTLPLLPSKKVARFGAQHVEIACAPIDIARLVGDPPVALADAERILRRSRRKLRNFQAVKCGDTLAREAERTARRSRAR